MEAIKKEITVKLKLIMDLEKMFLRNIQEYDSIRLIIRKLKNNILEKSMQKRSVN